MIISSITAKDYRNGWGFALIIDGEAVAVETFDIAEARELSGISKKTIDEMIARLKNTAAYKAAREEADDLFNRWMEGEIEEEEFCRAEPEIRFGMASGGEFTHTFTKREARQAGLPKNWQ